MIPIMSLVWDWINKMLSWSGVGVGEYQLAVVVTNFLLLAIWSAGIHNKISTCFWVIGV